MMEKNIKLHIIKIAMFLLTWICHFNNDLSTFSKSLDEKCCISRRLGTGTYGSLAKYEMNKNSINICLEENIRNNKMSDKKGIKRKITLPNKNLLNKAQYYTEVVDYNNAMFDGKHLHFEKKWIKKKDYDDFIDKNRKICDIYLKKLKFRNYGFGVSLFFLFFLLGIVIPVLTVFKPLIDAWKAIDKEDHPLHFLTEITEWLGVEKKPYIYIILFSVLMVMLSVMLIIALYKILRNNEKFKKIKLMTALID
ncbi:fam-m protein [Plasmodium malariae]|uniref:Fam-m protein n=1 Tax=Plasmodium malariae TaxID=5858 RepID=A0A1D3JHA1_PLAMA|nr:fam-m protein [Plasmodium malariae]SBT85560.1 fam-m protein [Plasmodium malariae]